MKLRVKQIDKYGYCGRDHHPVAADEGQIVVPFKLTTIYGSESSGDFMELSGGNVPEPARPGIAKLMLTGEGPTGVYIEQMWTCFREDGTIVELMEHEVVVWGHRGFDGVGEIGQV